MMKPAITGPEKPEIDNATASRPKLRTRSAPSASSPVSFWMHMWNTMKPRPISTLLAQSTGTDNIVAGSSSPAHIATEPASIGIRVPTRSIQRPIAIDSSIGAIAFSERIRPTTTVGASSRMAASEPVSRLAV